MSSQNANIAIFILSGPIDDSSIRHVIASSSHAVQNGFSEYRLYISSKGGYNVPAFAAYTHLRSLPIPVTTHNIGNVESAAVLLYLAGATRLAAPYSTFLFHNLDWTQTGTVVHDTLREFSKSLDFDSKRYADIFDDRTNKSIDIRACLAGKSLRIDTTAAAAAGITTSPTTENPALPIGATYWYMNP